MLVLLFCACQKTVLFKVAPPLYPVQLKKFVYGVFFGLRHFWAGKCKKTEKKYAFMYESPLFWKLGGVGYDEIAQMELRKKFTQKFKQITVSS